MVIGIYATTLYEGEGEPMKRCPQCHMEYEDHASTCSDCQMGLEEVKENDSIGNDLMTSHIDLKLLLDSDDDMEANMIVAMLEGNGIPTVAKTKGFGSYLRIIHGVNFYGTDIYVKEEDYHDALTLVEAYHSNLEAEDDQDFIREANAYRANRRKRMQKLLFVFWVLPTLIVIVFMFLQH